MEDLRALGRTGLKVSALTLGSSYLGNPAQTDGSPSPGAFDLAGRMLTGPFAAIDTSNNYAEGRSETVLGKAIAEHGVPAGRLIITKADADPETGRLDRDRVWRSFEESATRLGLDHIPLFHLHDPFHYVTFEEAFAAAGAVQGLSELKEQGLVGFIGIAAGEITLMRRYVNTGMFDAMVTHNRYTLVDTRAEELLNEAANLGMGIFNAAPFGGGLLAGQGSKYAYRESSPMLLQWVKRVHELCRLWALDLPTVALHFSLSSTLIHSTIVGISSPLRMNQLQNMVRADVPEAFWDELRLFGAPPSTLAD